MTIESFIKDLGPPKTGRWDYDVVRDRRDYDVTILLNDEDYTWYLLKQSG